MAEQPLDIDLRYGRQRLHANLKQLGAVGPTLLGGPPSPAAGTSPVIVAGNIVSGPKQQTMGQGRTPKPLADYLSQGKGRDGQDAGLFGPQDRPLDVARFTKAVDTDPRQFRFSVSLPAHVQYVPLQAYAEVLMARVEQDSGGRSIGLLPCTMIRRIPMCMSHSGARTWMTSPSSSRRTISVMACGNGPPRSRRG